MNLVHFGVKGTHFWQKLSDDNSYSYPVIYVRASYSRSRISRSRWKISCRLYGRLGSSEIRLNSSVDYFPRIQSSSVAKELQSPAVQLACGAVSLVSLVELSASDGLELKGRRCCTLSLVIRQMRCSTPVITMTSLTTSHIHHLMISPSYGLSAE